jgi:predicted TIM-barrel fold metal-dependent hydrolase
LGETEFVAGIAAMGASGTFGPSRVCARIVGNVDLTLGRRARDLLERHMIASGGRFAGIRHSTAWHADIHKVAPTEGMLLDSTFREGYAGLAALDLVYDAWVYHTQIDEVAEQAHAFPHTAIVLNHVGSILGGPFRDRAEVFADWRAAMARLAQRPNVTVKLGALPIRLPGSTASKEMPPSSEEIATAWGPWLTACIEMFGADRCMFESNFPVQKRWSSFAVTWNGFKRIAAGASADEAALFAGTAARIYGVRYEQFHEQAWQHTAPLRASIDALPFNTDSRQVVSAGIGSAGISSGCAVSGSVWTRALLAGARGRTERPVRGRRAGNVAVEQGLHGPI